MNEKISPDCRDGNCHKCDGVAWDLEKDEPTDCECVHHLGTFGKVLPCDKCGRIAGCDENCEDMNCDHCYCYREGRDG